MLALFASLCDLEVLSVSLGSELPLIRALCLGTDLPSCSPECASGRVSRVSHRDARKDRVSRRGRGIWRQREARYGEVATGRTLMPGVFILVIVPISR
jgi:hypothetical protein